MKVVSRKIRDDIASLHACGHTVDEIMQQLELSRSFVFAELRRRCLIGRPAQQRLKEDAVRLYGNGLKIKEVAVLLNSTNGTIGRIIATAGVGRSKLGMPNPGVAKARRKSVTVDGLKLCTRCHAWKNPVEFPPSSASLDGRRPNCNACHNKESTEWRSTTPAGRAYSARKAVERREAIKRATPSWVDLTAIDEIYLEARRFTRTLGEPYTVDHVIPLIGIVDDELGERPVSGLHVPKNLRVIPRTLNARKGNKHKEH